MKQLHYYFILFTTILTLFGCKKSTKSTIEIDNKSYINDFELLQENPIRQTSVKITSPKAIINSRSNDIEIFESLIEFINKNGNDFRVKSGNSTLNNTSNIIRGFNNVKISFLTNEDYYIITNSFDWDLKSSIIDINNPLDINFNTTNIFATNGNYNIDSGLLSLDNTEFYRNIFNSEGNEEYQLEIKSDFAKWFKTDNTLVFISNDKQVETTIRFLLTE